MKSFGPLLIVAFIALLVRVSEGHGFLKIPASRNVLANSDYCPQCLNSGGPSAVSDGQAWPAGRHGLCGDYHALAKPRPHEAGGRYYSGKITGNYTEGQVIKLSTVLTAYHKGTMSFRICRIAGSSVTDEGTQLTEECFDKNVLKQANVAGSQAPGDVHYYLGTDPSGAYDAYYQLPPGLTCDGVTNRCVLQWYYLTGNSCNPPNQPSQYISTNGLSTCGPNAPYPEEFWNCADITIRPASGFLPSPSSPVPSASPAPSPTASPRASPSPSPTASPQRSPSPVASPVPAVPSPLPSSSPSITPPSPAATFCGGKTSYGYYADRSAGCKSFYRCEANTSTYYNCPSGLMFNEKNSVCDWPANVSC